MLKERLTQEEIVGLIKGDAELPLEEETRGREGFFALVREFKMEYDEMIR